MLQMWAIQEQPFQAIQDKKSILWVSITSQEMKTKSSELERLAGRFIIELQKIK